MSDDDDPRDRFARAQARLIEHHGGVVDSRFATIDGPVESIHYLQAGAGEPVVFVPGIASPAALFVPLLAALADDLALYAPDRPGRGLSDPYYHERGDVRVFTRSFLDGFLDAIGHDRVHLVGSSFGGFQSLAYTIDRPQRVRRLSLVGSPAGLTRKLPWSFRLLGVRGVNRLMFGLIRNDSLEDARSTMEQINVEDASAISDPMLESILRAGQLPEQARSLKTLLQTTAGFRGVSRHMLVRDELDRIDHEMQFLWGSEDFFYGPDVGRRALPDTADVEFVELEGLGHTPWLEPDNDVPVRLEAFLAS